MSAMIVAAARPAAPPDMRAVASTRPIPTPSVIAIAAISKFTAMPARKRGRKFADSCAKSGFIGWLSRGQMPALEDNGHVAATPHDHHDDGRVENQQQGRSEERRVGKE